MNYEKVKELLLDDSRILTATEADEILHYLQQNPKAHAWLMNNKKCIQYAECYKGFNSDTELHEFTLSNIRVPSLKIATKFFETCDDMVIDFFIKLMVLPQLHDAGTKVFAWPYMSEKIIRLLPEKLVKFLCISTNFVFNFKDDTKLECVKTMFELFEDDINYLELLAVNSLNIDWGKLSSNYEGSMSGSMFVKLYAFSTHFFLEFDEDYASFRKLFSHYLYYNIFLQEDFIKEFNKQRGFIFS